jgi:hypothetical protein
VSWRRLLLIVVGTIGFTSFFLSFPFFYTLERNSPSAPAPALKQVYELSDHGYLFYVTLEQYYLFQTLVWGGFGVAALAALLNLRWKVIRNLTPQGWQLPK